MSGSRDKKLALLVEAIRAKPKEPRAIIDRRFPKQRAFVEDNSRYLAALCTRRAGKSNGLGFRFYRTALKYPGSISPYIALTRASAKNIMWPIFREINERYHLGAELIESTLEVKLPNKSVIALFGADMKNFIERLRGPKYPFAAVDEAQAFREHIHTLVDDILTPAVSDYDDGAIALTGTPGPVAKGLFHDITEGKAGGYSVHKWSVLDNPYLPNAKAFIEDLKRRKGWADDHPTYLREWMGQWVTDFEALVYKYDPSRNTAQVAPLSTGAWFYVLGVDLGYSPDPTAFVVCAYSLTDPRLFVLEAATELELTVSDVAERVKRYMSRFPNIRVVMDLGGQGKQIGAEISKRHGIPVQAAEKTDKAGFIEIMNSDFVKGQIKILPEALVHIESEYLSLQWDANSTRREEDSRFPNHLADACLYAWRYCYQYAWKPVEPVLEPTSEAAVERFWEREAEKIALGSMDPLDLF